jgi:lia operon protein LiaG
MTSGDTDVSGTTARELDYDATSGNADIEGSFTYISADVTSGTTNISTAIQPESAELSLTSGRMKLALPADISGFTVDYERTTGNIKSDFDYRGDDNEHSGVLTYGDGACRIEAEMVSGTIDIEKLM